MDYKDMPLEELQKIQAARKEEEAYKQKIIEDYKNSLHTEAPTIVTPVKLTKSGNEKGINFFKSFTEGKPHLYENFAFEAENDDCPADAGDWTPEDVFLNAIWHALYDSADLFKIAVKGIDINAGAGNTVKIRTMGKFSAPTAVAACECLTCGSASVSQIPISILQYGQMTTLCEFDIFSVGEKYRSEYLWAFGKTWGDFFNGLIWTELVSGAGDSNDTIVALTCEASLASTSCCEDSDLYKLYNGLDAIITDMRVNLYKPDYIIMHPTVAAIFRRMTVPVPIFYNSIVMGEGGRLVSVLGIPVIEYVGADACSDEGVYAVVIDSSRAIGAAFGKRPILESTRNIQCNSTDYVMWSYFGTSILDEDAIGVLSAA